MTWEQKEQVLRELFARMNGAKSNKENNKQIVPLSKLNKINNEIENDFNDDDDDESLKYMDRRDLLKSSNLGKST